MTATFPSQSGDQNLTKDFFNNSIVCISQTTYSCHFMSIYSSTHHLSIYNINYQNLRILPVATQPQKTFKQWRATYHVQGDNAKDWDKRHQHGPGIPQTAGGWSGGWSKLEPSHVHWYIIEYSNKSSSALDGLFSFKYSPRPIRRFIVVEQSGNVEAEEANGPHDTLV